MSDDPQPGGSTAASGRALLVDVARRFYLQDQSKVEIAGHLGLSRFKVARLLETARSTGVVRIEIVGEPTIDYALSTRLSEALGLDGALVVRSHEGQTAAETRRDIGAVAAGELTRLLGPSDVLGLPWSRSVAATVGALRSLPRCRSCNCRARWPSPTCSRRSILCAPPPT